MLSQEKSMNLKIGPSLRNSIPLMAKVCPESPVARTNKEPSKNSSGRYRAEEGRDQLSFHRLKIGSSKAQSNRGDDAIEGFLSFKSKVLSGKNERKNLGAGAGVESVETKMRSECSMLTPTSRTFASKQTRCACCRATKGENG